MTYNLFHILENVVGKDELGKNWEIFEIFAIFISILPWLFLILYIIFWRKYYLTYYVNGQLVNKRAYKYNQKIDKYIYENENVIVTKWYLDEELEKEITFTNMPKNNLKLYGSTQAEEND